MNVLLMSPTEDFAIQQPLFWGSEALVQDLGLQALIDAMSQGNDYQQDVVKKTILQSVNNPVSTILYRQAVLKDCMSNHPVIVSIQNIALEAITKEKEVYLGFFSRYPEAILSRSIQVMEIFVGELKKLRNIIDEHATGFTSKGFTRFASMVQSELTDEYLSLVTDHLKILKFEHGVTVSCQLGIANKGKNFILRFPNTTDKWWHHILDRYTSDAVYISERDEAGARALSVLKERGLNEIANLLAQSVEHILHFFTQLYTELLFYTGCLALERWLNLHDLPFCFPQISPEQFNADELFDIGLALQKQTAIVGNTFKAEAKPLILITGANQGGKTTFLRSIGIAQLMMQSGMFVPAQMYQSTAFEGIFTHFKREEDKQMTSGKFDEEMSRMSDIVDHLSCQSLLLFNESFSATNEREGSAIAKQIVSALLDKQIKVVFVTHLYDFPHYFCSCEKDKIYSLRAERQDDGNRTFRLSEALPLKTSFGEDLYKEIFTRT